MKQRGFNLTNVLPTSPNNVNSTCKIKVSYFETFRTETCSDTAFRSLREKSAWNLNFAINIKFEATKSSYNDQCQYYVVTFNVPRSKANCARELSSPKSPVERKVFVSS